MIYPRRIPGARRAGPRVDIWTVLLVVAFALAACGSNASSPSTSSGSPTTAGAAFPATIEHKYGTTEIPAQPERIVTVGLTDHDAFLALGVTPVGVTDWFGEQPHATWPLGPGPPR